MTHRRYLLLAYHFGPRGGTGALRWNAMSRHLAEVGWEADVVTLRRSEPPHASADGGPGSGIRVFEVPAPYWAESLVRRAASTPRRLVRMLTPSRNGSAAEEAPGASTSGGTHRSRMKARQALMQVLYGAARSYAEFVWTLRAIRLARRLGRERRYTAVIVSTPPHSTQLAGPILGRHLTVPYLADFRDPWPTRASRSYLMHPLEALLGRRFKAATMERAARVVCNTEVAQRTAQRLVAPPERVLAIPNGYDALEEVRRPDPHLFRVVYTGCLYPYHDVSALFAACGRLTRRIQLRSERFRLEFMGMDVNASGAVLRRLALEHGLEPCFVLHPPGSRKAALDLQQAAAVLVTFDHFHGQSVPTKFYDHVQLFGSLLLIGSREGALAAAAGKLGLQVIQPDDAAGLDACMDEAFRRWRDYTFHAPTDRSGFFDRAHQSQRWSKLLESLAHPSGPDGCT